MTAKRLTPVGPGSSPLTAQQRRSSERMGLLRDRVERVEPDLFAEHGDVLVGVAMILDYQAPQLQDDEFARALRKRWDRHQERVA